MLYSAGLISDAKPALELPDRSPVKPLVECKSALGLDLIFEPVSWREKEGSPNDGGGKKKEVLKFNHSARLVFE